jgi:hypothetical protein
MLLKKKKKFTMLRDQLSKERHKLPYRAVDKEYASSPIKRCKGQQIKKITFICLAAGHTEPMSQDNKMNRLLNCLCF